MNGLTPAAPRLQTEPTTFTPAIPPRQRGFVVSAFPVAWPSPLVRRSPHRRRGPRGRAKAVNRTARISPAVCNGCCSPRRHPSPLAALAFIPLLNEATPMIELNTSLNCAANRFDGKLRIESDAPFLGVDVLALLIGMADKDTGQLPTDLAGLQTVADRLDYLSFDCLSGLQGIGMILSAISLDTLPNESLNKLDKLIENLAALGMLANDYREAVTRDPRFPTIKP